MKIFSDLLNIQLIKYIMAKNDCYDVTPSPKGGWRVAREGASRAAGKYSTKREAVAAGRKISRNQGKELIIHNRNGRISQRDSHGHDPYPPKG